MRVFLKTRGVYYRGANAAGSLAREAVEFASIATATEFALREHLPEAEIAVRCDYLDREIEIPVLHEWCELEEQQGVRMAA